MEIKTFEAGPLSANNYLLIDNDEAVLIDCSEYKPEILKDVKLKYIILTHGHFDHVLGINATKQATGAKVLINKLDTERMEETASIMKTFGLMGVETPQADEFINEGDTIEFGNTKIQCIHTPGHTEGSMCYTVDDNIFTGDTLFKDFYGRCDLPGGDFEKIKESIKRLFALNENLNVFSGHGEKTTIGYEKKYNEIKGNL